MRFPFLHRRDPLGTRQTSSEKIVKHHRTNILQKLLVRNRVEAVLLAQSAWTER